MLQPRIRPLASAMRSLLLTPSCPSSFVSLRAASYATMSPGRQASKKEKPNVSPGGQQATKKEKASESSDKQATKKEKSSRAPAPSKRTPAPVSAPPSLKDIDLSTILRTYTPRTPGVRHLRRPINDHLWKGKPLRALTFPKKGQSRGGRNNSGRITVRHRGGGHKRRIRTVDFYRREPGAHLVERIEYDPGRTAHIALLTSKVTRKKSYIVAADGMRAGDVVHSYRAGIPQDLLDEMGGIIDPGIMAARTAHRGNCLPMHMIPVGTMIYCISSHAEGAAVFCRGAGTYGVITTKEEEENEDGSRVMVGQFVQVRLQSGEVRKIDKDAIATIGVASNIYYHYTSLGKAGRSRWLGIRPTVRGLAMNSVDHPHGGGRGKSKGNRIPVSPWGKPTKSGYKTRKVRNVNQMVITPRVRNMGRRRAKQSAAE